VVWVGGGTTGTGGKARPGPCTVGQDLSRMARPTAPNPCTPVPPPTHTHYKHVPFWADHHKSNTSCLSIKCLSDSTRVELEGVPKSSVSFVNMQCQRHIKEKQNISGTYQNLSVWFCLSGLSLSCKKSFPARSLDSVCLGPVCAESIKRKSHSPHGLSEPCALGTCLHLVCHAKSHFPHGLTCLDLVCLISVCVDTVCLPSAWTLSVWSSLSRCCLSRPYRQVGGLSCLFEHICATAP